MCYLCSKYEELYLLNEVLSSKLDVTYGCDWEENTEWKYLEGAGFRVQVIYNHRI
jgi:hypothetical protein